MEKRILPILVAVMMLLTMMLMMAGTAYADTVEVQIDGLKYRIDTEQCTAVLCEGSPRDEPLIIPEAVTYYDETSDSNISCSVTKIKDRAFYNSFFLPSVTLPASLISIGDQAFYGCDSLTTVSFEENSNLKTIGDSAFTYCSNLTSIDIPPSVNEIRASCFALTGIESIVLPEGLKVIEGDLFFGSKLKEVAIPSSVTEIWAWAFDGCDALTTIYFNGTKAQWDAIYKGLGMPDIEPICKEDPPAQVTVKGTSIKTLTSSKKAITVKWKKQTAKVNGSHITGYQIRLATNSKFTKNKKTVTVKGYKAVSKKVTKLKSKQKYYVKIRTYKIIDGKKYDSPWSKTMSVKTH